MIKDRQKKVLIIYEGEKTEENLFKNISRHFFADRADILIVALPAAANLYMLWVKLREDNFDTDVIEVLKEMNGDIAERLKNMETADFSEVYLFFDYDGHQKSNGGSYQRNIGRDAGLQDILSAPGRTKRL